MLAISNSEINTWARCPRKWLVSYYLGFVPANDPVCSPRNQGSRIHVALEGYYGYQLDPLTILDLLYSIELRKHPEEEQGIRAEHEVSKIMIEGYLEWLADTGEDSDLKVVATEQDLRVPLASVPGVELRSRMDQVGQRLSDGLLYFLDYKTSANFERHEMLELDPQMRFYAMMQQLASGALTGDPNAVAVAGGIVSSLRRVKRTARSEGPYYQRDSFRYNPAMIESAYRKATGICRQIKDARDKLDETYEAFEGGLHEVNQLQRTLLWPNQMPDRCKWDCPLSAGLCTMMDDGSDWPAALVSSGRFVQGDPYAYYNSDALRTLHADLEKP